MERLSLCDGWQFTDTFTDDFLQGDGEYERVRLPHTCNEVPFHYAAPEQVEMLCGYRRTIAAPADWKNKRVFIHFDGAAHVATVYGNGRETGSHSGGYTGFSVELTDVLEYGKENTITVRLDTSESCNVPPFGYVIDYLTYGGLYREAWLEIGAQAFVSDVFVKTPQPEAVLTDIQIENPQLVDSLEWEIRSSDGTICRKESMPGNQVHAMTAVNYSVPGVQPWKVDQPELYTFTVTLIGFDHQMLDTKSVRFGFRQAEFRKDGFYLNGQKIKLRGLNRHQSYPYVGYAMPASMQKQDAAILKNELHVNAVRTSHYPQSQHFIDACDELGLLVFTEIPGWQCIKDDKDWKDAVCRNVEEMVLQYRNHPSIILWGVRVNESQDNDELYTKTNEIAHRLDPTRQTSGVRYLLRSHLLEDVYAFNDFSHSGGKRALLSRRFVSPSRDKGYFISEFNGHMYPTKVFDISERRQEQALRYANVLNAAQKDGIAGCFGWCMFDYQTHGEFGSGDRICYHGVLDMFRNPKLAAAFYASQDEKAPVLEIGSDMDIGDYPGGTVGDTYLFTNADSVSLHKNGELVRHFPARSKRWKRLSHPPIYLSDTVGPIIEKGEHWPHKKAEAIEDSFLSIQRSGLKIPVSVALKTLWRLLRWRVSPARAYQLFIKYYVSWGAVSPCYRFDAVKDGKVVASVTKEVSRKLHLDVKVSHTILKEDNTYDVAAIRVRIADQNGNVAHYAQVPVSFAAEGEMALIGPSSVSAEGGMCGTYVKTIGKSGTGRLIITSGLTEDVTVDFTVGAAPKEHEI